MEDQELVSRILDRDTCAFAVLIKNTQGLVAQIVFKMIDDTEDRRDIVQDIYLKVYKNLRDFKFQSKLSTWIARIAYNTCFNYLEKRKLILMKSDLEENEKDETLLETLTHQFIDLYNNETLKHMFKSELSGILQLAIKKLPPVYSTLITLYHYRELNYEEIAEITGLPDGTIKSYLFRARKALKADILLTYKKEEL